MSTPATPPKTVLLTVGATFPFPQLTNTILTPPILTTLSSLGYTHLRIQHGSVQLPLPLAFHSSDSTPQPPTTPMNPINTTNQTHPITTTTHPSLPLTITTFAFTPTLASEISQASLVISHAGSGTILDALRLVKRVVVVPNEELMDNHQVELAEELERQGYLVHGRIETLADAIRKAESADFKHFPRSGSERFAGIVEEEMGFEAEG